MYEYVHVNVFLCQGWGQGSDPLEQELHSGVTCWHVCWELSSINQQAIVPVLSRFHFVLV